MILLFKKVLYLEKKIRISKYAIKNAKYFLKTFLLIEVR